VREYERRINVEQAVGNIERTSVFEILKDANGCY
jgi:hypothetical protein